MTTDLLDRAQAGDADAFARLVGPYRRELQVHCYRLLGSAADAEDALQETLLSAWQGLPAFEGRASIRTWLYRVATSRCMDALRSGRRRPAPVTPSPDGLTPPEPTRLGDVLWLEPYPDDLLTGIADSAPGPETRYESREAISLAFITALQLLPPRQRAAVLLRDVLGFHASEAARILDVSEESVTSALKRARAALERHRPSAQLPAPPPGSPAERELVERLTAAFESADVDAIIAMMTEDAWLTMPPLPLAVPGPQARRRVPYRHGVPAWLDRPAHPGQGERPARVRLLCPRPRHRQLLHGRADGPHPVRHPGLGDDTLRSGCPAQIRAPAIPQQLKLTRIRSSIAGSTTTSPRRTRPAEEGALQDGN